MFRYKTRRIADDAPLRKRLEELAAERRRFGYRRLAVLLQGGGHRSEPQTHSPRVPGSQSASTEAHPTPSCPWARQPRAGRHRLHHIAPGKPTQNAFIEDTVLLVKPDLARSWQ